jgi:hypothetical protein
MKTLKFIPLFMALIVGFTAMSQNQDGEMKTLFNKSSDAKVSHGGYGSFSVGYSQVDNMDAIQVGGRAAWIANHRFAIGLAGYGFFNTLSKNYNIEDDPSKYNLAGGYGGLFIEPILMPNKPIHVSFPVIFGVGGVSAMQSDNWTTNYSNHSVNYYDTDAYLVIEPGIDIEFNIVKFFRLALGASYRYTNGVNLKYKYLDNNYEEQSIVVDKDALNSFTVNIGFKFGWF